MTDFNLSLDNQDISHLNQQILDSFLKSTPTNDEKPLEVINNTTAPDNEFAKLGLAPVLLKSITKTGYTTPTPIQAQAIPPALLGRDLLLSAQTGSGKTAAFVLPILHHIHQQQKDNKKPKDIEKPKNKRERKPFKKVQALILTPTRELAHQVSDSIRRYGANMKDLFSVPLVGGSAYSGQIRALKKGVQIIVATPGRLLDHIEAGRVDLADLAILVLDEADRMLDMGFAEDIERILQATPSQRQTIMSSATWDGEVGKIAESFTNNPERINIKVESAHIEEKVYFCDNFDHKNKLLESLICDKERQQAIIFTATKKSTEELAERLTGWGHKVCYLHGDLPQGKRNRIVADLRSGKFDLVVATDVAARGIDLPNISHVFNYDLPRQTEDYVHRIGRSGRAGRTGIAINLCSRDDRRQLFAINRYLKRDMTEATVVGLEPKIVEKKERKTRNSRHERFSSERHGRFYDKAEKPTKFAKKSDSKFSEKRDNHRPLSYKDKTENKENSKKPSRFDKKFDRPQLSKGVKEEKFNRPSNKRAIKRKFGDDTTEIGLYSSKSI